MLSNLRGTVAMNNLCNLSVGDESSSDFASWALFSVTRCCFSPELPVVILLSLDDGVPQT